MRILSALLVALLVGGCSAEPAATMPSASETWTLVIVEGEPGGPGISVAEAQAHGPTDDIVSVTGALFVDADGTVRLCDAIAESFPPQCGGATLLVEGLDLTSVELEEANGVRWAEGVTLLGSVE
jgi:hypothetical protein